MLCYFMRRSFSSFFVGAFLTLPVTGLAEEAKPIRLGAPLQLTGNLSTYGQLIRGGIELAVRDLRAEGIPLEIVVEDVPFSGPGVMSGFRKLVEVDHIAGIAGNFSNVAMAAMAPEIARRKLPSFHTAAVDPLISDNNDWIFSTNVPIAEEAARVASFLYKTLGLSTVAVLSIQTNFGQEYRNTFKSEFQRLGGKIVSDETFEITDPTYRTQLTRIQKAKPEAIFFATFGHFLGLALKESKELRLTVPRFSVYESEDDSVIQSAGGAADGLRYFVTKAAGSSPVYAEFRKRFVQQYNREPGTFGANAYDATMLLSRALHSCNSKAECTKDKLYATKDYEGVSGKLSITADGTARKAFFLRTIRDGQFVDASD